MVADSTLGVAVLLLCQALFFCRVGLSVCLNLESQEKCLRLLNIW